MLFYKGFSSKLRQVIHGFKVLIMQVSFLKPCRAPETPFFLFSLLLFRSQNRNVVPLAKKRT